MPHAVFIFIVNYSRYKFLEIIKNFGNIFRKKNNKKRRRRIPRDSLELEKTLQDNWYVFAGVIVINDYD